MTMRRAGVTVILTAWATTVASVGCSQTYPIKPIRIITGGAGGSTDIAARLIAQGLSAAWGQQVFVDSRGTGSAGGALPSEIVSKSAPDGYTLLLTSGVLWITPLLRDKVPWDPIRDFAPITMVASSSDLVVVPPTLPVTTIRQLIALAKARPGELNYGSSTAGSSSHLAPELFKAMAGINIVRIAYRGTTPALNSLAVGEVQLMILASSAATPYVNARRLKALAVTSLRPSTRFPGLPTVAASGVPGYESGTITGMFAPARTPELVIVRLNREIVQFVGRDDVKEKIVSNGADPIGSTPERLITAVKDEMAKWGKLIRDAGIRAD